MTADELDAAIAAIKRKAEDGVKHAEKSLCKLIAARESRRNETREDRGQRLRTRLAWEVQQDRLAEKVGGQPPAQRY